MLGHLLALWQSLYRGLALTAAELPDKPHSEGHQRQLQQMLTCIQSSYGEPLTLADIAGAAFISKSSAMHIFQQGLGITPVAYLIEYRLQQAAGMLRGTSRSVTEIAGRTGFQSAGYFCRQFKKMFGCTPLDYRKGRQG